MDARHRPSIDGLGHTHLPDGRQICTENDSGACRTHSYGFEYESATRQERHNAPWRIFLSDPVYGSPPRRRWLADRGHLLSRLTFPGGDRGRAGHTDGRWAASLPDIDRYRTTVRLLGRFAGGRSRLGRCSRNCRYGRAAVRVNDFRHAAEVCARALAASGHVRGCSPPSTSAANAANPRPARMLQAAAQAGSRDEGACARCMQLALVRTHDVRRQQPLQRRIVDEQQHPDGRGRDEWRTPTRPRPRPMTPNTSS